MKETKTSDAYATLGFKCVAPKNVNKDSAKSSVKTGKGDLRQGGKK